MLARWNNSPGSDALSTLVRSFAPFKDETGSQIVEFGLVLLPLLAFLFLIIDIAWICFAQSSLQYAAQMGVRAAVVNPVPPQGMGQDAYLKGVVQSNAMGFLAGQDGLNEITIQYYSPSGAAISKGGNTGGNIIEISVNNVAVSSLGPIFRETSATLHLNANSSDVMEALAPGALPPAR